MFFKSVDILLKNPGRIISLLYCLIWFPGIVMISPGGFAQETIQKDIGDIFSSKDASGSAMPEINKLYLPLIPFVGYSPNNGFLIGAGIAGSILLDSNEHTHISGILANFMLTTKKQVNLNLRHNLYSSHDLWIFQGDWRLLFFSQPTYGLGINDFPATFSLNAISTASESGAQPIRFNYLRLFETVFRKINKRLYAGFGMGLDYNYNIRDERLDTLASPPFYTSHYAYSILKGFSTRHYLVSGPVFKILYDSRDNAINSYRGSYIEMGFRVNGKFFGSSAKSTRLLTEVRKYQTFGKGINLLAFWFIGNFLVSGSEPYLALPAIGWDTGNRSGRGYIQGRFRGENLVYIESEFRFRLRPDGLLGGVIFLNAVSADNQSTGQKLMDDVAIGFGAGLRIKMNKETRTNICADFGLGRNGSGGIYFGIQETF